MSLFGSVESLIAWTREVRRTQTRSLAWCIHRSKAWTSLTFKFFKESDIFTQELWEIGVSLQGSQDGRSLSRERGLCFTKLNRSAVCFSTAAAHICCLSAAQTGSAAHRAPTHHHRKRRCGECWPTASAWSQLHLPLWPMQRGRLHPLCSFAHFMQKKFQVSAKKAKEF